MIYPKISSQFNSKLDNVKPLNFLADLSGCVEAHEFKFLCQLGWFSQRQSHISWTNRFSNVFAIIQLLSHVNALITSTVKHE